MKNFHSEHFPSIPQPRNFFHVYSGANAYGHDNEYGSGHSGQNEAIVYGEEDGGDDDDSLGYYADGVKRTLTDEQIAIFRHTEVEMLLKDRRREREEQREREEEEKGLGREVGPKAEIELDTEMDIEVDTEGMMDTSTLECQQTEIRTARKESLQPPDELHRTVPELTDENPNNANPATTLENAQSHSRRKRSRTKRTANNGGAGEGSMDAEEAGNVWNFRRRARELDEKEEQHFELDY